MEYAVIKSGGKQYFVKQGDKIVLDKLADTSKEVIFKDVLLLVSDSKLKIGKPTLSDTKVYATLLETKKGKKIRVSKFKAKSRYRRTIGFRPLQTTVEITKIDGLSNKKIEKTRQSSKK